MEGWSWGGWRWLRKMGWLGEFRREWRVGSEMKGEVDDQGWEEGGEEKMGGLVQRSAGWGRGWCKLR